MILRITEVHGVTAVPGGIGNGGQHEHSCIEEELLMVDGHQMPWWREAKFGAQGLRLKCGPNEVHIPMSVLWAIGVEAEPGLARPDEDGGA